MRRILATTALLAAALLWAGCGGGEKGSSNANSTGTTTYGNSGAGAPQTTGAAPSAANTATGNKGQSAPGIKPPTDK